VSKAYDEPETVGEEVITLIEMVGQVQHATIRAIASSQAIALAKQKGIVTDLVEPMIESMARAWKSIDIGSLRVRVGFGIARVLAETTPDLSKKYLQDTEEFRTTLGGLTSEDAESLYALCLQLAIRAFSGLVTRGANQSKDVESLAVLIDRIPGYGSRAILWSEVALRCAIQDNRSLCLDVFHERVQPALSAIPTDDVDYKQFVLSSISATQYEVSEQAAIGRLPELTPRYRDRACMNIVSCLFRRRVPSDPEEYVPGTGYDAPYAALFQITSVMTQMASDALIYDTLQKVVDCLVMPDGPLKGTQKEEIFRRLQDIVATSFPKTNYIRHDGYKVIARAQLSRFRSDSDIPGLIKAAEAIDNTADRAFVLFVTATALHKTARAAATDLVTKARQVAVKIPADWDRIQRLIGFAQDARSFSPSLSRQLLQDAAAELKTDNYSSLRRIVDLAYRLDQGFARDLVDKLDDGGAQRRANQQLKLLDLRQRLVDEKKVEDELEAASPAECSRLGSMLLADLVSGRMSGLKADTLRACIQAADLPSLMWTR
jgi:hypothetical protein